jgi:hypothetical protein
MGKVPKKDMEPKVSVSILNTRAISEFTTSPEMFNHVQIVTEQDYIITGDLLYMGPDPRHTPESKKNFYEAFGGVLVAHNVKHDSIRKEESI